MCVSGGGSGQLGRDTTQAQMAHIWLRIRIRKKSTSPIYRQVLGFPRIPAYEGQADGCVEEQQGPLRKDTGHVNQRVEEPTLLPTA